jgi:hypothetical protein
MIRPRRFHGLPGAALALLFAVASVHAQSSLHGSQWIFGKEAWVDFSAGTPVVRRASGMTSYEANTTFSDSLGRLIWFSDGYAVYDREFVEMSNGRFLDTITDQNFTNAQGVLALPDPGHENRSYALFIAGDYAIIDHRLNGGLGGVVGPPYLRNWHAPASPRGVTEKLTAVRHANGRDWWVLTLIADGWPDTPRAPKLGVALLDPSGIRPIHEADLGLPKTGVPQWIFGELGVSPSGSKLIFSGVGNAGIRLFGFDRCSGLPGSALDSLMLDYPAYCFEFSPNEEVIYLGLGNELYQWNLNPGQFDTSLYLIGTVPPTYNIAGLKLGPDDHVYVGSGSIYTIEHPLFVETVFNKSISTIEMPNIPGFGCGFNPAALPLDSVLMTWGLTDHANYALGALEGSPCDTLSGGSTVVGAPSPEAAPVLYPNPTRQEWRLSGLRDGAYEYALYDALGRELLRGTWTVSGPHRIPAADLSRGWYGIRVEREGRLVWRGAALRE